MPAARGSSAKRWCFTLNNYSPEEEAVVQSFIVEKCSYGIYGREVGESGTPHLQGFVCLQTKSRLSQLKSGLSERAHFELARGTPADSRLYCSKEGSTFEHGVCPGKSSTRRTRDEIALEFERSVAEEGSGIESFKDNNPGAYFFSGHTLLRNYLGLRRPRDRPNVGCRWFFGVPGIGKSKLAHELLPDAFIKEPRTKWWTGYRLERTCIVDDLAPKGISLSHFLTWLDRYKCWVETKGGMAPLYVETWIITSNFHPSAVYKLEDGSEHPQIEALLRRIEVTEFVYLPCGSVNKVRV